MKNGEFRDVEVEECLTEDGSLMNAEMDMLERRPVAVVDDRLLSTLEIGSKPTDDVVRKACGAQLLKKTIMVYGVKRYTQV